MKIVRLPLFSINPALVLFVFFSSTSFLFADLNSIEATINKGSDSSDNSSTYNSYTVEEKGGFQENTQVIGVENLVDKTNFEPASFNKWMELYYEAQVIEYFMSLSRRNLIDSNGVALDNIQYGAISFKQGEVVLPARFTPEFKREFNTQELFRTLQDANVLDENGFIADFPNYSNEFYAGDFNYLLDRINPMYIGLSGSLDDDMKLQLFEFLVSQQKVKKVTTYTTTTYTSREDNFLEQVGMQLAGSLVGKYLFKDKTDVTKQKESWVPHLYTPKYLSGYKIGFNEYPFKYNSGSRWLWNGDVSQTQLFFDYLQSEDIDQYLIAIKRVRALAVKDILGKFQTSHVYGHVYSRNHLLQDGDESLSFYTLGIGAGGSITYKHSLDVGFGLAVQNGDDTSVGLHTFLEWDWYMFRPLSLNVHLGLFEQPDETGSKWSLSEQSIGLNLHIASMALRTGYRRLGTGPDTLTDSVFAGVSTQF